SRTSAKTMRRARSRSRSELRHGPIGCPSAPGRHPHARRPALLGEPRLPPEGPRAVELLPRDRRDHAGRARDDRLLPLPVGRAERIAALRGPRGRLDGHRVDDAFRLGRRDPVAALAGDARAPDRRAGAVHRRAGPADARDGRLRPRLARLDARVGPRPVPGPTRPPASDPLRDRGAVRCDRARPPRPLARVDLRAVPQRERALQPARRARLAHHRDARADLAAAGLGRTALLGARPDVGDPRDPRLGARRRPAAGDPHVPRARAPLHADRRSLPSPLRAPRPSPRDPRADMTALRIFFIGGGISYRALFNWISPWHYIPTMLGGTLFVLLFFTYLGRYTDVEDESFFVVGNAVYISPISCVYAAIMASATERFPGTLSPLLATPANRLA